MFPQYFSFGVEIRHHLLTLYLNELFVLIQEFNFLFEFLCLFTLLL